ncbi:hypothetical protein [Polaribacter sp. Hel_I_88]|uniref:hypothetical protein n=1 Tax=Polaribacter sp. Hel_I_88 TaxID=1250006 RepID=UPI00047C84DE|nr:hypothetical protein [Polaribacter sp. Hel_I_88]
MKNENIEYESNRFDTINPFLISGIYRIEDLDLTLTDAQIMAVFVRNFSCYLYYHYDIGHAPYDGDGSPSILLHKIKFGKNYNKFFSYNKLEEFAEAELFQFTIEKLPEAMLYVHFIKTHKACFKTIDRLFASNLHFENIMDSSYRGYIQTLNLSVHNLEIIEIDEAFNLLASIILKEVYSSLLFESDFNLCNFQATKEALDTVIFHLNNRLLFEDQKRQLQVSALLWFAQFIDTLCFELKIEEPPAFVHQIKNYFSSKLPLAGLQDTPDYPQVIFASYQGYHLFDTLAKGLSTKVVISFLYRFLYEKGHILVKDTPFRAWYNAQDYAIQLTTATETLKNSKSVDREQFVVIVADLLGVEM